jgi:hypothetical protein
MPDVLLVLFYVVVLWLPGGLLAALAGLRGWTLAATAPLLTYTVAGLAGPWSDALGLRWSVLTFLGWWVLFAAVVFAVRWFSGLRVQPLAPLWPIRAQAGVIACVVAAAAISVFVVVNGMGGLSTVPQDWDAVWHANSIRWIADTGEGGLYAPGALNWYESSGGMFYPNGYHLVASLVYGVSGNSVVEVLNAHTVFLPALVALSVVAVVRRFGGRAVVAGLSALMIVSTAAFYDNLWRGPLLPFSTGLALTPLAVILVVDLLDADGVRAKLRPALVLVLGMAGLICVHSSTAFGAALFVLPVLVLRWTRDRQVALRELGTLAVVGVATGVLASVELLGMLGSGSGVEGVDWPASETASQAVGDILMWGHGQQFPQWWLGVFLIVGLVTFRKLGDLRWLGAVAAVFGLLFVVSAAYDTPWSMDLTRPWWNDRWRLIALTAIPLCVIAAHGLAEAQRNLGDLLRRVPNGRLVAAAMAVLVMAGLTSGFYVGRNEERMGINTNGKAVTAEKIEAYEELGKIVPAGERVLNDRGDGSVWMYAMAGVRPVAGHYDATLTGPEANLLANRFNKYETDPKVREAVRNLHVGYVMVGRGFLRPGATRQPGLRNLDRLDVLEKVYENRDVVIYKIKTESDA